MTAGLALARDVARRIVDFALPPRCSGCGEITEAPHRLCLSCWQSLTFLGDPCCARCALPFDYAQGEGAECAGCIAKPPYYDSLRAAVAYGDVARAVVLKLKYGGKPWVAETLARFMRRHADFGENAVIAPVPLHRARMWKRGFNQSALISVALARGRDVDLELDLVRRIKATPPLKGMNASERAAAVGGAFALNPKCKPLIQGRTIFLVDDVFTTGATVNACARLLKRSGAGAVNIICWARVVRGGDE